ncbi:kinase non-catalytic C-lobe domain-containing protein 1 isoform X2 [Amblyraja radiata]|uniref:kinase non-catalytic C-lobe domain-containing protein 1 isoform X2 n=1 Tax=Amblyraja radiata TaxID=386614 RepID=UPI0014028BF3|nr:kinase non-catalytic C-lobe domain-containing protein 1 isoform X2 [Amblyraja radiata]
MALYYDEDDEREYYEFEPLPTLLEDEENVSLADILSLRDSCLSEQDIWAACLECCLSMRSIAHTPLFHTLCITPDTLAFNANGNVCFMEQLSDDPEGAFVPPEFDVTGNTFEAHAYSLGATLAAAAEYVIEPELKPNLSKELKSLLDQMQQEKPEERPDIEIVLSTCEEKLKCLSSDVICRNLSAIGRRVLSIESVGAFQDGSEETYKEKKRQAGVGHELQTSERNPADGSSSTEDLACDLSMLTSGTIELVCQAEKDAQDVDPDDSTTEILEVLQQDSEDTTNAAEKLVGNEGVLSLDLADAIADGKTKGEQADSILSLPSKRSSTRKRILPKLPTEMADSAQQQLHSKMDLDGSFTPVPSPVSLSNIAAESLYSLDILSSKDCSQEAQFRTQNNDVCFLARNSLPFGRLSANSSSEHIRKVASVEAINKNLSSILNSTFDESSEQFVKYSSVIGKKSSIKKLKSKFSPISVPSSDTPSQLGPLPPCGILLESSTAAGHCSNNVPATRGHFFNMSNHISSAARTSGSNHRNDSKQSHSSSVNDLSQSNVLLFRNITQHCEDEDIEPLPPIRATDNCPAEYPGDQQCISLKELLSEDNKSLRDHELWALCHECLISLKHCKDYPEYLCLESAYIDPSGEVLFVSSVNNDNLDSFYLAPEFVKQGVITEKVCVYGVAAILWTAAKFNAPLNQKLPLSKNLKMLLLDMAKRTSAERPSITEALKICNEYLINRGIDSREVLIFLRNSVLQNFHRKEMTVNGLNYKTEKLEHSYSSLENATFAQESSRLGFVPLAIDSKLTAVKGPIPCQVSVNTKSPSKLPEAFTSPATHFKPIILTQSKEKTSTNALNKCPGSKEFVKATKEGIQNKQGAMPIEGIEHDVVVETSRLNFKNETLDRTMHTAASLKSLLNQTNNNLSSSANISPVVENKINIPHTIFCQHQDANSFSAAVSTTSVDDVLLHLPALEHVTLLPSTCGGKLNSLFPESTVISCRETGKNSGGGFKCIGSQSQSTSSPKLNGNVDEKSSIKPHSGSDPSTDNLNNVVDFKSVAEIPLSDRCLFEQESMAVRNELKTVTATPSISAEISENNHIPSACIPISPQDNLKAINSSNSEPIDLLQKTIHLIKEEFAYDGYLEHDEEASIMGEYILSLKSLKFSTFSSAISEKFYDLYWDDSLLERLYEVVNGSPPYSATLSKVAIKPVFNDCNPTLQNKTKEKKLFLVQKRQRGGKDAWDKTMLRSEKETVDMETREICKQPQLSRSNPPELKLNHLSDNLVAAKCKEDQLQTNADVIHRQDISNTMPNATDLTKLESGNGDEKENISKHLHPMESSCQITAESCISFEGVKLSQSNEVREGNASLITESSMGKKRCNPGWKSAMFGIECFNQQMKTCKKQPDQLNSNEEENIEAKLSELEQQLMMEIKNFRKTKTFYQKLLQQEKGCKGTDAKMLLPKLKQELQEIKVKVEQLDEEKKYLKMLRMELWSLDSSLLLSLVSSPFQLKALDRKASDSISFLTFHVPGSDQNHSENKTQVLQAGTVGGLMAYLYSSNAVMGGYVQQFFYTFRYFTSPCEFLQFLQDRFNSVTDISLKQKGSPDCMKVYNRSLDLLQAWIEECYSMDFVQDAVILHKLETFVSRKVIPIDVRGQYLINLLKTLSDGKMAFTLSYSSFNFEDMKIDEDNDSVHSVSIKCSDEDISRKSFKWKITKSTESSSPHHKERCNNTAAAPPRPCYNNFTTEHLGVYQKPGHKDHFTLAVYSAQHIAQQLTLLQQELFQDCHPVHFLNSRSFGINDTPSTVLKSVTSEVTSLESNSLFVPKYKQHQHLRQLIKYADNVSHWVSAEIVTCNTCKSQSALLSKFLSIGKFCYEWRNFATAMQILSSLENLIVRQLPSWKSLSSKALEIMEELTGVQVFLKSDSLCLMVGDSFKTQSTIPCARILAMHVQQLEIGAFTMANGTYKWPKLRKIAKVISQIRAFQEKPYMFTPDLELQTHLRQQISNFSDVDVHALAAENKHNFYQCPTERHSRKIQDTLRKMKATFQ